MLEAEIMIVGYTSLVAGITTAICKARNKKKNNKLLLEIQELKNRIKALESSRET